MEKEAVLWYEPEPSGRRQLIFSDPHTSLTETPHAAAFRSRSQRPRGQEVPRYYRGSGGLPGGLYRAGEARQGPVSEAADQVNGYVLAA